MRDVRVRNTVLAVFALSAAAAAYSTAGPGTWDWGEVEAGKSYASLLRVANKCDADVVISISHQVPGLAIPSTATIPPGLSDVKGLMTVPVNAHGDLTGQLTVQFSGMADPPCLAGVQVYLVKGRVVNAAGGGDAPGGGRGKNIGGAGGRKPGDPPAPAKPISGSWYNDALDSFHEARDLGDDARDAQLEGDKEAAHALAAKALDKLQAARTALEEGLKNGDIGEQAGTALRDFIAEEDKAARKVFDETAPGAAPGTPTGPTMTRPTGGGTAPRPPRVPDKDDDPRDEPPPVTYGEEIDEDGPVGVLVVRDDDDWVPWFNGFTTVTAKIYQRDARRPGVWLPSPSAKRQITLTFLRRSKEPGQNLNTDLEDGPQNAADLFMGQQHHRGARCTDDPAKLGQFGSCQTLDDENEYIFRITSGDDGAYGAVEAACDKCVALRPIGPKRFGRDDAFPIGIEESVSEKRAALLPRDENGNRISDGYLQETMHVKRAADDDDDEPKGNGTKGDGLSAYEEYRGFNDVNDEHVRTSWTRKDLFVENLEGFPVSMFQDASGLNVHEIRDTQHNRRVINFNDGFAHAVDQHALRLVSDDLGAERLGASPIGPPKKVAAVFINIQRFTAVRVDGDGRLEGVARGRERRTDAYRPRLPDHLAGGATVWTLLQVVAHELGHAVGMRHHGDSKTYEEWWLPPAPAGNGTRERGNRHAGENLCGYTLPAPVLFGQKHNQSSGDLMCLMRYPNHGVAFKQEDGSVQCRGRSPSSDQFCERREGTGWNGGNRVAGDAAKGNCKSQIIVNDTYAGGLP